MILQSKCHNCGKQIRFFSFAKDRMELSKLKTFTQIDLKCRKCGQIDKYDINDIFVESKIIKILALMIFLIGTPLILLLLWDYIGTFRNICAAATMTGLIMIPCSIYGIMTKNINNKQRIFNQNKI
jgi:hypothetical protein